jgi:hypothetical protein
LYIYTFTLFYNHSSTAYGKLALISTASYEGATLMTTGGGGGQEKDREVYERGEKGICLVALFVCRIVLLSVIRFC